MLGRFINGFASKLVDTTAGQAASLLLTTLVIRRLAEFVFGGVLLAVAMLIALAILLIVAWKRTRSRIGRVVSVFAMLCVAIVACTVFSFASTKPVRSDAEFFARPDLVQYLRESYSGVIKDSHYNVIEVSDDIVVSEDRSGDLHVVVPMIWTRRDDHVSKRVYRVVMHLESEAQRSQTGERIYMDMSLVDYSISPFQGMWAYLVGWAEGPFLVSEAHMVQQPLFEKLDFRLNGEK